MGLDSITPPRLKAAEIKVVRTEKDVNEALARGWDLFAVTGIEDRVPSAFREMVGSDYMRFTLVRWEGSNVQPLPEEDPLD